MNTRWLFLALAVGMINPAFAGKHPDQSQIRVWVEQGEILSLEAILQRHPLGGELLDAELEWEDDSLVYELKWLDQQGQRHETYIDARSGVWLGYERDDD